MQRNKTDRRPFWQGFPAEEDCVRSAVNNENNPTERTIQQLIVIGGPSGVGKTTMGKKLARALDAPFLEGDQFHPIANVRKMSNGTPLTMADRLPWIAVMAEAINQETSPLLVLACSALNEDIRDAIRQQVDRDCLFFILDVPKDQLRIRLERRKGHFMKADMLDSQLATLNFGTDTVPVDATRSMKWMVDFMCTRLKIWSDQ